MYMEKAMALHSSTHIYIYIYIYIYQLALSTETRVHGESRSNNISGETCTLSAQTLIAQ